MVASQEGGAGRDHAGEEAVDFVERVGMQVDAGGVDVLVDVRRGAAARDGDDRWMLVQQPGQTGLPKITGT